jgi:predicted ABC-type ATPase
MDLQLRKDHPEMNDQERRAVISQYMKAQWGKALVEKSSFALEANFRTALEREAIHRGFLEPFREAGHSLMLYCFGLDHLVESFKRIDRRVLEGGYGVEAEAIRQSFHMGPIQIQKDLAAYDQVNFLHTDGSRVELLAILLKEGRERLQLRETPEWFRRDYQKHVEALYPYKTLADYVDLSMGQRLDQGFKKGLWI